jgi:hypothetical protein
MERYFVKETKSCYGEDEFRPPASLGPESTYEGPPMDLIVTLKITPVSPGEVWNVC